MREIKFRGRHASGQWIYGFYVHDEEWAKHYIYAQEKVGAYFQSCPNVVDGTTIGLFTGKRDFYGTEIFAGDRVQNVNEGSDAFGEEGVVEWHPTICGFTVIFEAIGSDKLLGLYSKLKVIGNIHDNHELLT